MDIKLIALDMDGTLLEDDHVTVPARNLAALRAAADRGVLLAIASGRAWKLLTDVAAQLPMVHYAILANGGSVLDIRSGAWIYQNCIPPARGAGLIRLLLDRGYPFEVYHRGDTYVQADWAGRISERIERELSPGFRSVFQRTARLPADLPAALASREIEKINIFHVPPEERQDFLIQALAGGPLSVANSLDQNLELGAPGASKAAALQALCRRLDIPAEAVMAFGDAGNDLEMLSWAGWSFAMGNAWPEARAAARFQTGANYEAGVAMAIEQYVPCFHNAAL